MPSVPPRAASVPSSLCTDHPWFVDKVVDVIGPVGTSRPVFAYQFSEGRCASSVLYYSGIRVTELATADAYATAAFAMGEAGPEWTASLGLYEAMTILADGRVLLTPGFPCVKA